MRSTIVGRRSDADLDAVGQRVQSTQPIVEDVVAEYNVSTGSVEGD